MTERDGHFLSGDASLRLRDEGAGAAVVFIHGWTLDLDAWEPQAAALAGSFRAIRYDRRGFGMSGGKPGRAADVEDLGRLLDLLRLEGATLVAHSQGARVALAFALRHPERVAALVLDGPPGEGGEDFSIAEFRRLAGEQGMEAFRSAWSSHPLMRLHAADGEARSRVARMLARYPGRDLQAADEAPGLPAAREGLARLRMPALIVNGEFDTPARRRAGEWMARALPLAERALLPGAGHLPNLDAPRAYNDALQAFLRKQSRAAA